MAKGLMLVPTQIGVGLHTMLSGVSHLIAAQGCRVTAFRPIVDDLQHQPGSWLTKLWGQEHEPLTLTQFEQLLTDQKTDVIIDRIVARFKQLEKDYDVILIAGIALRSHGLMVHEINQKIAHALDAQVVFVATPDSFPEQTVANKLDMLAQSYQAKDIKVMGAMINKLFAPLDHAGQVYLDFGQYPEPLSDEALQAKTKAYKLPSRQLPLLAKVPWDRALLAPRIAEVASRLQAEWVFEGDNHRRIHFVTLCTREVANMVTALTAGTLIITSADRHDIILAACMAAANGVQLGGVLLTGGYALPEPIEALCQRTVVESQLPILRVADNSLVTSQKIQTMSLQIPSDDSEKIKLIEEHMVHYIEPDWINDWLVLESKKQMNEVAFRYQLVHLAKEADKHIILPEGQEPRTIMAAIKAVEQEIARITLFGDQARIEEVAFNNGVTLPKSIRVIDPEQVDLGPYIKEMVALRSKKGVTPEIATAQLQDPIVLATMMLAMGECDGLVAGAEHPTASVLRPALQLIRTKPDAKLVSSVFFMGFSDQVRVFGDCAVNPEPDEAMLAEIAIQSARSAALFQIEPKVAMISYASGQSSSGDQVQRVRRATELVRQQCPELCIDGPLQYDAAINVSVASSKVPDSQVAGKATVLVFPDLNTGNTTYKAVQRSTNMVCIGPMLQGLNRPVNDLSRGASIEDIYYTIAITCVQAKEV
jgi:phosphate acetyltransferase